MADGISKIISFANEKSLILRKIYVRKCY